MIQTENGYIRTADVDDAPAFHAFANSDRPRALFFDVRRELTFPTLTEITEMLRSKEVKKGVVYAAEDAAGRVRGFGTLKPASLDTQTSEFIVAFADPADYATPLAADVLHFLADLAFVDRRWRKLVAQALEAEAEYCVFLESQGLERNGVQRDAIFAKGRYHGLSTFTLYGAEWRARKGMAAAS